MRLSRDFCTHIGIILIKYGKFIVLAGIIASCDSKIVGACWNSDYISINKIMKIDIDDLLTEIIGE